MMNRIKITALILSFFMMKSFAQTAGSLDATFGAATFMLPAGITATPVAYSAIANAVAMQPDGKIVLGGTALNYQAPSAFAVARVNANGTMDNTFGNAGKVSTIIGTGGAAVSAIAIQPDGKIIAAGWSTNSFTSNYTLIRYNTNGVIDSTFGSAGIVITDLGWSRIYSISLRSDGKIVAIGKAVEPTVVLYNTNGSLDTTFGAKGIATMPSNSTYASDIYAGAVQPDNKMIAVGSISVGSTSGFGVVRFNANGTPDSTFGTYGKVQTDAGLSNWANATALQADGKIIAAGYASGSNQFETVRYKTDGTIDSTFGTYGKIMTSVGTGGYVEANAVTVQVDGKILVTGPIQTHDMGLIRYNSDGSLDTTFGSGGKVITSYVAAYGITLQADGKIVVAGNSINGSNNLFAVARYISSSNLNGIETISNTNSLNIYPNPISNNVTIETSMFTPESVLTILNLNGQELVKKTINNSITQLDISALVSGVYFIKLTTNNTTEVKKIIKQ